MSILFGVIMPVCVRSAPRRWVG